MSTAKDIEVGFSWRVKHLGKTLTRRYAVRVPITADVPKDAAAAEEYEKSDDGAAAMATDRAARHTAHLTVAAFRRIHKSSGPGPVIERLVDRDAAWKDGSQDAAAIAAHAGEMAARKKVTDLEASHKAKASAEAEQKAALAAAAAADADEKAAEAEHVPQ
jgi:hypothetical protein